MSGAARHGIAVMLVLLGGSGWLLGASESSVLNRQIAAQRSLAAAVAESGKLDVEAEQRLAEAYWQRNPGVAANDIFGRNGRLGIFGAREHWIRYGRVEGLHWGE